MIDSDREKRILSLPPVVFCVFNRPEATRRAWEQIRAAAPARLLVIADAARSAVPGEVERVQAVRRIVANPDWPCEVSRCYAEANMGCRNRMASGINWAFSQVEQAIVLEDDCLANASFFDFCAVMLDRYRDTPQVMHVSGDSFLPWRFPWHDKAVYGFSRYFHVWGWATWRRAWALYDVSMSDWLSGGESHIPFKDDDVAIRYWREQCGLAHAGKLDTWDVQWQYAGWKHGGLAVTPRCNLVSNIGFDIQATHTKTLLSPFACRPRRNLDVAALAAEPPHLATNPAIDAYEFDHVYGGQALRRSARFLGRLRVEHLRHPVQTVLAQASRVRQRLNSLAIERFSRRIPRYHVSQCWCGETLPPEATVGAFHRCDACRTWVNTAPPTPSAAAAFYSRKGYWGWMAKAHGWPSLAHRGALYRDDGRLAYWLDAIADFVKPGQQVIEVGCAPGVLLTELAKRGCQCVGVEASADVAGWIRKDTGLDIRAGFFPSSELNLPACDLFLAFDVLEHVGRPDLFLAAARALLRPGGTMVVQAPIERHDDHHPFKNRAELFLDVGHLCIFSETSLEILAERANLRLLRLDDGWSLGHELAFFRTP